MSVPQLPLARYFCANRFVRYFLESLERILLVDNLKIVLEHAHLSHLVDNYPPNNKIKAFDFAHFAMLMISLEAFAGEESGRDIARRAGHHIMTTYAQDFGDVINSFNSASFQILSLQAKLKIGIPAFVNLHTDSLFYEATLYHPDVNNIMITTERSPVCWGRYATSDHSVCALTVGIIEGGLIHITKGLEFEVVEEMCQARGDDLCRFKINIKSLISN